MPAVLRLRRLLCVAAAANRANVETSPELARSVGARRFAQSIAALTFFKLPNPYGLRCTALARTALARTALARTALARTAPARTALQCLRRPAPHAQI